MSNIKRRDPLAAIAEYRSKSVPIAEYNLLLERLEQLENTVKALQQVNTQLSEVINTKPPQKERISFIE